MLIGVLGAECCVLREVLIMMYHYMNDINDNNNNSRRIIHVGWSSNTHNVMVSYLVVVHRIITNRCILMVDDHLISQLIPCNTIIIAMMLHDTA